MAVSGRPISDSRDLWLVAAKQSVADVDLAVLAFAALHPTTRMLTAVMGTRTSRSSVHSMPC